MINEHPVGLFLQGLDNYKDEKTLTLSLDKIKNIRESIMRKIGGIKSSMSRCSCDEYNRIQIVQMFHLIEKEVIDQLHFGMSDSQRKQKLNDIRNRTMRVCMWCHKEQVFDDTFDGKNIRCSKCGSNGYLVTKYESFSKVDAKEVVKGVKK